MLRCFLLTYLASCLCAFGLSESLPKADDHFLDDLERRAFLFVWEQSDPKTGLSKDRSKADGEDQRVMASVASTGFGLSALCIAAERGYTNRADIKQRVDNTLRFLWEKMPQDHGFYYHFIDMRTGEREWKCELSTIDTSLLLCGVIMAGEYFGGETKELARKIYERVDWTYMLRDGLILHGWRPETGFINNKWDNYCEHMMIYLLAIGSPTHPIPVDSWDKWSRPKVTYKDFTYISDKAPLFVHQYSHAWFDFRRKRDKFADYFQNSVIATKAHKQFCLDQRERFPKWNENLWGVTASDSQKGYTAWGGPPEQGKLDGTIVPCAAAGSLPFLLPDTLAVLKHIKNDFGGTVYKRYGFVDAFNPHNGWVNPDVIGIDVGITMLMAENARTEFVWRTFMKNKAAQRAMSLVFKN